VDAGGELHVVERRVLLELVEQAQIDRVEVHDAIILQQWRRVNIIA
jgi:hypothetical protein